MEEIEKARRWEGRRGRGGRGDREVTSEEDQAHSGYPGRGASPGNSASRWIYGNFLFLLQGLLDPVNAGLLEPHPNPTPSLQSQPKAVMRFGFIGWAV